MQIKVRKADINTQIAGLSQINRNKKITADLLVYRSFLALLVGLEPTI
jgi:hypothetical protein